MSASQGSALRVERKLDRRRKRRRPSLASIRVSDLARLFRARYGSILPDDDSGRDDLVIMAQHLAQLAGDPRRRIGAWVRTWAPWCGVGALDDIIADAILKPRRWRADQLAWRLRLTEADRAALAIRTIGAIDRGKGARAARRRESKRLRKEAVRRANGVTPRRDYEAASTATAKPWDALGISRRTWYRRGRPTALPDTLPPDGPAAPPG